MKSSHWQTRAEDIKSGGSMFIPVPGGEERRPPLEKGLQNSASDDGLQKARARGVGAIWNVLSLCAPLIGLLVGLSVMLSSTTGQFRMALGLFCASCVLGLLCATVAVTRGERGWGVTLLGFVINGMGLLLLFD